MFYIIFNRLKLRIFNVLIMVLNILCQIILRFQLLFWIKILDGIFFSFEIIKRKSWNIIFKIKRSSKSIHTFLVSANILNLRNFFFFLFLNSTRILLIILIIWFHPRRLKIFILITSFFNLNLFKFILSSISLLKIILISIKIKKIRLWISLNEGKFEWFKV